MLWQKRKPVVTEGEGLGLAKKVATEAEALYRSGKYHCAEAVLEAIRKEFSPETPEAVVGTVSGFGGGSVSGRGC